MTSVQQQEGYFRDLVERLVHQFEGRAHYDDEVAIIREAREALTKTENVSTSGGHDDGVTGGNMTKMRKALAEILKSCRFWIEKGTIHQKTFKKYTDIITDALAAPPRNCDKYADGDYAFAAWHDSLKDGDVVSVCHAFAWLFATEGGRDA